MKIEITDKVNCLDRLFNLPSETKEAILDFQTCKFVQPEVLVSLAQLVIEGINKGVKYSYIEPAKTDVKNYLIDIQWVDFIRNNLVYGSTIQPINKGTALPLWRVTAEYKANYTMFAHRYFEETVANDKDWSAFENILNEVLDNVNDHSKCETGAYIFAQFFPKQKDLKIAIADLGVGLVHSVNNYRTKEGNPTLSPYEAVKKAFERGFSSRTQPHNRGFGLDNLLSLLSSCEGSLTIYTQNAYVEVLSKGKPVWNDYPLQTFRGTLFCITFKPSLLPLRTMEDDFNW